MRRPLQKSSFTAPRGLGGKSCPHKISSSLVKQPREAKNDGPRTNQPSDKKVSKFSVVFTSDLRKKRKVFRDGQVRLTLDAKGRLVAALSDEDNKLVCKDYVEAGEVNTGEEFTLKGRFLVEVGVLKTGPLSLQPLNLKSDPALQPLSNRPSSLKPKVNLKLKLKSKKRPSLSGATKNPLTKKQRADGTSSLYQLGDKVFLDAKLNSVLRPHQKQGLQFMFDACCGVTLKNRFGCILADDMGLGKTLQAISLVWTLLKQKLGGVGCTIRKAVVVCPSTLVENWEREFTKWLGRSKVQTIAIKKSGSGAQKLLNEFVSTKVRPVLIISYESFRSYAAMLNEADIGLLVCDEGHRLKSASGNQTVAALSESPAMRRVILTGTPIQNHLGEFFAMMNFVNPGLLGHAASFRADFQRAIEKGRDRDASEEDRDKSNAQAFKLQQITARFILRRTGEAILRKFLPPKQTYLVFCSLSPTQRALYREKLADYQKNKTDQLAVLSSLTQLATHPALADKTGAQTRNWRKSNKLRVVEALLQAVMAFCPSDKLVLVSSFTATLDLLAELCEAIGIRTSRLDGATAQKDRDRIVSRFNDARIPDLKVLLLSAKAGGCGLNLVGANRIVLVDPNWNPSVDYQAMARVWRDGQTKPVCIYRLFVTDTVEEKILQRQISKKSTADGVVLGRSQPVNTASSHQFSREELKQLFEAPFLDKRVECPWHCATFEMLQQGADEDHPVKDDDGTVWHSFTGFQDVDDFALQTVVRENPGLFTWVHGVSLPGCTV